MKFSNQIMTLVAIATTSCIAGAADVYESDDQQGVAEFSDQASPGARQVDIDPNVVHVSPVTPVDSPSSAATARSVTEAADRGQPQEPDHHRINEYEDENRHVTQGVEPRHVTQDAEPRHVTEAGGRHVDED
ncbi:MAG: hypothetical protein DRQ60_00710 [Gammaproteobacteria bacterium]|nr:MAG: hypothetical protein DRQ54_08210 [Gammaproteobacteria bacterium]RLA13656.1 MAG: hypothetical protein DRQ52_05825 [Gammaproteobacteria bacterium]RLA17939.1 MAG: hypothetical protein DRQ60_00710 [Gammaproteobacteria bacterium]